MVLDMAELTVIIIIATAFAIAYSLRHVILLERRIERVDDNLVAISKKILQQETKKRK